MVSVQQDTTAEYAAALRNLHEAAGSPTGEMIKRQAAIQRPPLTVSESSWSDWLNGKNVPSAKPVAAFLVSYLRGRSRQHTPTYSAPQDSWWEAMRLRALAERRTGQGRGGRPRRQVQVIEAGETREQGGVDEYPRRPHALPSRWNVGARNPDFTGRTGLLDQLRESFNSTPGAVLALSGIGGVGKTQMAVEYCYRFASDYDLAWWIDAERTETIGEQIRSLAVTAQLAQVETDIPTAARVVGEYLRTRDRWLLIFDNAEHPESLTRWLPGGPGHVLITSRNGHWAGLAAVLVVEPFERPESVNFLRCVVAELSHDDATSLAKALADLPLALAQAGGTIAQTGMGGAEYLDLLEETAAKLLSSFPPVSYPSSLAAAVATAADRLERDHLAASRMLQLCAYFGPEPIPVRLFREAPTGLLAEPLASAAADGLSFRRMLQRISHYGLARITQDGLRIHRLTAAIVREMIGKDQETQTKPQAENLLVAWQPADALDPAVRSQWNQLIPHLLATHPINTSNLALRDLLCHATGYLLWQGDTELGTQLAAESYARWRDCLGADDHHTLRAATNLARAFRIAARYNDARGLDEETQQRRERILGPVHPDTLTSANNLATDERLLGNLERAAELDRRTLDTRRRVLGREHRDTLHSAMNLAAALRLLGDLSESIELNRETLDIRRRTLGVNHLDPLATVRNMALDLHASGDIKAAHRLNAETLNRYLAMLGPDSQETLLCAHNLALDLHALGQLEAAVHLDEDTWQRRRAIFGPGHPHTRASAGNLAKGLRLLGEHARADEIEAAARSASPSRVIVAELAPGETSDAASQ